MVSGFDLCGLHCIIIPRIYFTLRAGLPFLLQTTIAFICGHSFLEKFTIDNSVHSTSVGWGCGLRSKVIYIVHPIPTIVVVPALLLGKH